MKTHLQKLIKNSLNYTLLVSLLLAFFSTFLIPVKAADNGYVTQFIPLDSTVYYRGTNKLKEAYRHYQDPLLLDLFKNGVSKKGMFVYLPMPIVIRTAVKNDLGSLSYVDDPYPDSIYTDANIYTDLNIPQTYQKRCGGNTDANSKGDSNGKQSSVIFYVEVSELIRLNKLLEDPETPLNKKGGDVFLSQKLASAPKDGKVVLEYCYNNQILYNNKIFRDALNNNQTYSRKVIGSTLLKKYKAFPPKFQEGQLQFTTAYGLNSGISISDPNLTSTVRPTTTQPILTQGYRYGEFQIMAYSNPLNCQLQTPLLNTDVFGNRIIGVETALGCLPGSFEGVFAVVTRIATGISALVLFILVLLNALTLAQSSANPEIIKKCINNIIRGIIAFFIIIFAVLVLNVFGIKIIDLDSFGSVSTEQIYGP